jgi:F-type H+-transporting ATPase subunit b
MLDLSLLAVAAEHGAEAAAHGAAHAEPAAFGFITPGMWVALAMTTLILVMVWKKVPGMITSGLDASIAEIRKQLDEAKALRAEAEALRKEYADKIAGAEKEAAEMIEHARHEAEAIVAKGADRRTARQGRCCCSRCSRHADRREPRRQGRQGPG